MADVGMDPIIEELQADYRSIGDLIHSIDSQAAMIAFELKRNRPNVDAIQAGAVKIHKCVSSLRHIMQLPEVH